MPVDDAGHGVDVNVGECRCPGTPPTPHPDGDVVTLAPKLTLPMAASLNQRMRVDAQASGDASQAGVQFSLMTGYLRPAPVGGIVAWSFLEEGEPDKRGEPTSVPVPITPDNIERLIPWANGGMEVAEEADRLYGQDFLAPFLRRTSSSSKPGRTATSTSASRASGQTPHVRSKPSLRPVSGGRKSA